MHNLYRFYEDKDVLVTGGAGFIGSHVVDMAVSLGAKVTVVDNLRSGNLKNLSKSLNKIKFVELDIRDGQIKELVSTSDVVFHLAAISTIADCEGSPELCEEVNAKATASICENLPENSTIVFSSTSAVYGNTSEFCDENSRLSPISHYAQCKLFGEDSCKNTRGKAVVLRYFNVYGPRQNTNPQTSAVVQKFMAALQNGDPITIFGDGSQRRDYVSVFEVAKANLIVAAQSEQKFAIYNIASGTSLTLLQLLSRLEQATGKNCAKINFLPKRPFDVIDSLANCEKYKNFLKSLGENNDLAREDFSLCTNIF